MSGASTWVRSHPGIVVAVLVLLISAIVAHMLPLESAPMLDDVNVIQILGVILAGQLAVLALTVPALFEVRAMIEDSEHADELTGFVDKISRELRSNTVWSFVFFGLMFLSSILAEALSGSTWGQLPMGLDAAKLFAGAKITFVVLSCLSMWDSVEPLFGLGEAHSIMKSQPTLPEEKRASTNLGA